MEKLKISSTICFHYYSDYGKAKKFFSEVLGLEVAYDFDWAILFKVVSKSFIGVVNKEKSSITLAKHSKNLFSITVSNIDDIYKRLSDCQDEYVFGLTEIKEFSDIKLKSFFFKCFEGYEFEIQEFQTEELKEIF